MSESNGRNLDSVIKKIEKIIEELENGNKRIMDKIKVLFREHKVRYWSEPNQNSKITAFLEVNHRRYDLDVLVDRRIINLQLVFLFNVESDAIPIVAMYMAEFNNSESVIMKMNLDRGELTLNAVVEDGEACSADILWKKVCILTCTAETVYTRLYRMAMGKVSIKTRRLYSDLLLGALERIEDFEEENDDEVEYGIEEMKKNLQREEEYEDEEEHESDDLNESDEAAEEQGEDFTEKSNSARSEKDDGEESSGGDENHKTTEESSGDVVQTGERVSAIMQYMNIGDEEEDC